MFIWSLQFYRITSKIIFVKWPPPNFMHIRSRFIVFFMTFLTTCGGECFTSRRIFFFRLHKVCDLFACIRDFKNTSRKKSESVKSRKLADKYRSPTRDVKGLQNACCNVFTNVGDVCICGTTVFLKPNSSMCARKKSLIMIL